MAFKRRRYNPKAIVSSYASIKMGRSVPTNSTIEHDLCPLMEYERWVKGYKSEPWTIRAPFRDGSTHEYTMDYWIETDGGFTIVECKPADREDGDHARRQIAIGGAYAAENGGGFLLVTERDLRAGPYLDNVKLLCRYGRQDVPPALARRCLAHVAARPDGARLWDVATDLAAGRHPSTHVGYIHSLLFWHSLHVDLHAGPLGWDSRVFVPEQRPAEAGADLTARHFGGPLRIGRRASGDLAGGDSVGSETRGGEIYGAV